MICCTGPLLAGTDGTLTAGAGAGVGLGGLVVVVVIGSRTGGPGLEGGGGEAGDTVTRPDPAVSVSLLYLTGLAIFSRPSQAGDRLSVSSSPGSHLMSTLTWLLAELPLSMSGWGWVSVSDISLFSISRHLLRISCVGSSLLLISGVLKPEGELGRELAEESESESESEEEVSRSDSVIPANMSVLLSLLTSILVELTLGMGTVRLLVSAAVFSSLLLRKEREDIKLSDILDAGALTTHNRGSPRYLNSARLSIGRAMFIVSENYEANISLSRSGKFLGLGLHLSAGTRHHL